MKFLRDVTGQANYKSWEVSGSPDSWTEGRQSLDNSKGGTFKVFEWWCFEES